MLNVFNSIVLFRIISPNLQQQMIEKGVENARDQMEKQNMSDSDIDKRLEIVKKLPYELIGYGFSVFYGLVLSLLIALFVKRNPDARNQGISGGGTV